MGDQQGEKEVALLSGPAGGVSGARRCADLLGISDLVPFDMGGTSTDISLISERRASLSADGMLATVKDANLHTTSYQYDAARRPTVMIDALGHGTQTAYDAAGNFVVRDVESH